VNEPGHYNLHRTYDPSSGRYLEIDPLSRRGPVTANRSGSVRSRNLDRNVYSYSKGDPNNFLDPSGLFAVGFGLSGGGAAIPVPGLPGPIGTAACVSVIDSNGDVGLLCCGGAGLGYGLAEGLDGGLAGLFCPTCDSICDLPGVYGSMEASLGLGAGVSLGIGASISSTSVAFLGTLGAFGGAGGYGGLAGGACRLITSTRSCETCPAE
jgi:RHS repeat-associated protein